MIEFVAAFVLANNNSPTAKTAWDEWVICASQEGKNRATSNNNSVESVVAEAMSVCKLDEVRLRADVRARVSSGDECIIEAVAVGLKDDARFAVLGSVLRARGIDPETYPIDFTVRESDLACVKR